ncbi:MAG: S9 family peptidase [Gemmatimonadota bacterium]|nr:S9 family peptidase [Gemmatimonadota bacterium]
MNSPLLACALAVATTLAAAAPLTAQDAAQDADHLRLEQYLDWEWVDDPEISPDGTRVVYTRSWVDRVNDRRESAIWIMNADGSRNRFLVDGSSPRWSPDGTRIAYTAEGEPDGTQIFVRWMDAEGATSQVTRVEHGPSSVEWSPDGTRLSFSMNVEGESPWRVDLPDRPDGADWTGEPKVVNRLDYRQDRQGYTDDGYRHLFVVPAEGGTPRQLTDGDWDHGSGTWSADGSELYFSGLRVENAEYEWRESEIYAVEVATGRIRQLTTREGPDGSPVPSPDGRLVAYQGYDMTDDAYVERGLYVMNADGTDPRRIAGEMGRSLGNVTWAPDASGVYFNASMEGVRNVWFAPLDGEPRPVTEGDHMLSFNSMDEAGAVMVGTRSAPRTPEDLVRFDTDAPERVAQLTHVNDDVLAGVELGEVEEIRYESVDDFEIQGWIVKPPDFDPSREYPLMLAIHGGPHGMYNVGFNFGWQEHAANGYVVLYTNPRGSSGYGSPFGNAIENAYPGRDFDDLMRGVDEVLERGYVDENNLFVYGCSGGGVLTSWVVGHTDRFAAASANCPVTNWLSFVGTTDSPNWYHNFEELPWEDPSEHLRRSPLMYVGNVTTPTMLMTGEQDLRTPMPQTEEYYQALKLLQVPTVMVRFQNQWHGTTSRPSNFLRTQLYLRGWFERHARTPAATEESSPR